MNNTLQRYLIHDARARMYSVKIDSTRTGEHDYYHLFVVNRDGQLVDVTDAVAEALRLPLLHPLRALRWQGSPGGRFSLYDALQTIIGEDHVLALIHF